MDVSQDRFEDLGEFLSMDGSKIIKEAWTLMPELFPKQNLEGK